MTLKVMVDLETMSTSSTAAITQIGACASDGRAPFKATVNLQSSVDAGLKLDLSTIEWWMQQSDGARASVFSGARICLDEALVGFADWLYGSTTQFMQGAKPIECELWAYPAQFDVTILDSAYRACKLEIPWHYRAPRCMRTLASLYPDVARVKAELEHDALSDAQAQMTWLELMLAEHAKRAEPAIRTDSPCTAPVVIARF